MRRDLISAERVRLAARGDKRLTLTTGRAVLTDEARDLAHRLGVTLEWVEETTLLSPVATRAGTSPKPEQQTEPRVQVALASDHGGFAARRHLALELVKAGYSVHELGCADAQPTDYPVWAQAVAECVSRGEASRGIMLDTVGVASAMVCNRVPGVRAAACESEAVALSSRRHNDANVLTLGGRLGADTCLALALVWLAEPFEGGRHVKRVEQIMSLDQRRDSVR